MTDIESSPSMPTPICFILENSFLYFLVFLSFSFPDCEISEIRVGLAFLPPSWQSSWYIAEVSDCFLAGGLPSAKGV
jgi:hypothetical protein